MDGILKDLEDVNDLVRISAVRRLGETGDIKVVKPLIASLGDDNLGVREAAAEALGKIGDTRAVKPLIKTLKDMYSAVRKKAVEALSKINDPGVVEHLTGALKDEYFGVREEAARALAGIADTGTTVPLINALNDEYYGVRDSALAALKNIAASGKFDVFRNALKNKDWDIRKGAVAVLDGSGWKPSTNNELILYLAAKEEWNKWPAAAEDKINILFDSLKDRSPSTRRDAAEILDIIGWQPANADELALYYAAKITWDTLPGTGKDDSDIFIEAMKDKNPHIREMAVQALGNTGGAGALESIIPATRETDYNVREGAIIALKKIKGRLLIEDYYFVCQKCLLRYQQHEAKIPSSESITYCACPKCHGDSQYWVGIKKIVLLLDHNFKEFCLNKEETLIVNWFKREELFDRGDLTDYDEIRLEDTDDYEVEKLVMILRNDMNDKKRERLPEIPVRLSSRLKLSQAKINMLKDNFKTVINE